MNCVRVGETGVGEREKVEVNWGRVGGDMR